MASATDAPIDLAAMSNPLVVEMSSGGELSCAAVTSRVRLIPVPSPKGTPYPHIPFPLLSEAVAERTGFCVSLHPYKKDTQS